MAQVRAFIFEGGAVKQNLGEVYVTDLKPDQYLRIPIRTGLAADGPPTNDPLVPIDIKSVTFRGEILSDHEIIAAFKSIEDFRVAIIHYGGFEQQDMFER